MPADEFCSRSQRSVIPGSLTPWHKFSSCITLFHGMQSAQFQKARGHHKYLYQRVNGVTLELDLFMLELQWEWTYLHKSFRKYFKRLVFTYHLVKTVQVYANKQCVNYTMWDSLEMYRCMDQVWYGMIYTFICCIPFI